MTPAPRARRIAGALLLGALVGALVAGRFETAFACVLVAAMGAAIVRAPWPTLRAVLLLASGVLVAIALNGWLVHGAPIVARPFAPSREGLLLGVLLALRLTGAAIALHGLRAAWPGERAADELASRLAPLERLRVPVRAARAVTGLALRFAPLVAHEAGRIARLQDLRAGGPPRTRRQWLERRRALAVPLMVCTLERAERVALGMEARHYRVRPVPALPRAWGAEACGMALALAALVWRR